MSDQFLIFDIFENPFKGFFLTTKGTVVFEIKLFVFSSWSIIDYFNFIYYLLFTIYYFTIFSD